MGHRKHSISTFPRFLYLNSYAFLLLAMGVGIAIVPCYRMGGWWFVVPQAIVALTCLKGAWRILHSWGDKKRKYHVLMERNTPTLRPETFREYMQAPCGRLLTKTVLSDLGKREAYRELKALEEPLPRRLRKACKPQKTTIYINKDFQP